MFVSVSTVYFCILFVCSCVGIEEHQSADIDTYHCPNCQPEHGPLTCKTSLYSSYSQNMAPSPSYPLHLTPLPAPSPMGHTYPLSFPTPYIPYPSASPITYGTLPTPYLSPPLIPYPSASPITYGTYLPLIFPHPLYLTPLTSRLPTLTSSLPLLPVRYHTHLPLIPYPSPM